MIFSLTFGQKCVPFCASFHWGRVNFLHSGWFWICAEHNVNDIRRFFVIAEQSLPRAKAFSALCPATLARTLGLHGRLGGDTAGQVTTADTRDIPEHMIPCPVYRVEGRRRKGGTWTDGDEGLLSWEWLLTAHGEHSLFCLACRCSSCFTYETVFKPMNFLTVTLTVLLVGKGESGCVRLGCCPGLNRKTFKIIFSDTLPEGINFHCKIWFNWIGIFQTETILSCSSNGPTLF